MIKEQKNTEKTILPPYLLEERNRMIVEMRKKGYSLQNIADVFCVSKALIFQIAGPETPEDQKVNLEDNKK